MKLILLLISLTTYSQNKFELSEQAKKEFLDLNFFENGRGMTVSPNLSRYVNIFKKSNKKLSKLDKFIFKKRLQETYGFNVLEDRVAGLFNEKYKGMDVGVLGCVACHGGKAAGKFIAGLGNKTIDVGRIGADAVLVQKIWGTNRTNPDFLKIQKVAMNFAQISADQKITNLSMGLIPDSSIKTFFYKEAKVPYRSRVSRAQVKVPHLWGLKEKRKTGIFWGAESSGENIGWEFGAELFASDSSEHLRAVLPKLTHAVENIIYKFESPAYPFDINELRAKLGKKLFDKSCAKCHGVHQRGEDGYPIYHRPKLIPIEVVKTDEDRLKGWDEYARLVEKSSISDVLKLNHRDKKGYVAPNLWGIWARFPYLHNASVPTLYDLFLEPSKRQKFFDMKNAGEENRFDKKLIGLEYPNKGSRAYEEFVNKAESGARNIYYTKREGHSNKGHYFKFMKNYTQDEIYSIIEYLKSL